MFFSAIPPTNLLFYKEKLKYKFIYLRRLSVGWNVGILCDQLFFYVS